MKQNMPNRVLYIFLDEAGNLDFTKNGTRYFVLSGIVKERPFHAYRELTELKYNLVEQGVAIEYFHAAEDNQAVRDHVFNIIERNLPDVSVDAVIIEKQRVETGLRGEEHFYPKVLGTLLRIILQRCAAVDFREVIVFTDSLPVSRKRSAIEKAVKITLATMLPPNVRYRVLHHASKSNMDLQIADYCTWAIYRKWNTGDERSYNRVRSAVQSECSVLAGTGGFPIP